MKGKPIALLSLIASFLACIFCVDASAQSGLQPPPLRHLLRGGGSAEITVECPTSIGVGVVTVPQGWSSYDRKAFYFNSLKVIEDKSSKKFTIYCSYGSKDEHTISREFPPTYLCIEVAKRLVECKPRVIIPKK